MDRRVEFAFLVVGVAVQLAWSPRFADGQELPGNRLRSDPTIDDLGAKFIEAPPVEPTGPRKVETNPNYSITEIRVKGNLTTRENTILENIGLYPGAVVAADDPRLRENRRRLIDLGLFLDVELALSRGARRGDAVLVVTVVERGSLVIDDFFLGKSDATPWWAGTHVTETNLMGRGIKLGGGFLGSGNPGVTGATPVRAAEMNLLLPMDGEGSTWLQTHLRASESSEFFRVSNASSDSSPSGFVASQTLRLGGDLAVGVPVSTLTRMWVGGRAESLNASFQQSPVATDYAIHRGRSFLSAFVIGIDLDTTSHRAFPRHGMRLQVDLQNSLPVLGSSYTFHRTHINLRRYFRTGANHAIALHGFVGAIIGDAPYFDQFFVGDLNPLLPGRMMGVNTSTRPSHNWLSSSINETRFGNYAGRLIVEYAIPLWRASGLLYAGDAFVSFGAFSLAQIADMRFHGRSGLNGIPVDLIGDAGIRVDTAFGLFSLSAGNAVGRTPF